MNEDVRYINNSEIETFKECRRKWYLGYFLRYDRAEEEYTGPLAIGNATHAILEAYYRGTTVPNWRERMRDPKEIELVEIMIEGYHEWLEETGADAGLKIEAVEEQLAVPLGVIRGREVSLTGRLDLRFTTPDGRLYLVDHKTSASFNRTIGDLRMNTQLLRYAIMIHKVYGIHISGAIYNILRKVKRTAKAKPPFYLRETVHFSDTQFDNEWKHTQGLVEEIMRAEERLNAGEDSHIVCPPSFDYQRCSWKCPFFEICPTIDQLENPNELLSTIYKKKEIVDIQPITA